MMVDRAAQHFRRNRPRQIEMCGLPKRMHPGIGAARAVDGDPLAAEPGDRCLKRFLHRQAVRLALPAGEPGSVIFDRQFVARHGRTGKIECPYCSRLFVNRATSVADSGELSASSGQSSATSE